MIAPMVAHRMWKEKVRQLKQKGQRQTTDIVS